MESYEQTKLASKIETDPEKRLIALGGGCGGRDQVKRKKDSWTCTTMWWLCGRGGYKGGVNGTLIIITKNKKEYRRF